MPRLQPSSSRQWVPYPSTSSSIGEARRPSAIRLSRELSVGSPLYHRLISSMLDLLVPAGLSIDIPDLPSSLEPPVDWFLHTGPSALFPSLRTLFTSYFVDGELVLLARVNSADGRVTLSWIDPVDIMEIEASDFTPVSLTVSGFDAPLKVIRFDPARLRLVGDVFFFALHPAGYHTGLRGMPLLSPMLDEVAAFSELFYRRVNKLSALATYYWDVTLRGASEGQVRDFLNSPWSIPPDSGQVFAHNEQVSWSFVSPQVPSMHEEGKFMMGVLAGAAGLTPEFLGHELARDLSTEAIFTALLHLKNLQSFVVEPTLRALVSFQLQTAADRLGVRRVPSFSIGIPEFAARSVQRMSSALDRFINAFRTAVDSGLMTQEEARSMVSALLSSLAL